MRKRSEKLEETALWQVYQKKMSCGTERMVWLKKVYQAAAEYLKDVRRVFRNFTLHDQTHILNVLDAMGGTLGDQIENLTEGEAELLILAASLHDIGMVYTDDEIEYELEDKEACREFVKNNCPAYFGCAPKDWPENIRQWYLRARHPFRITEVLLNHKAWRDLFDDCPNGVVSKQCVWAVCRAHGEDAEQLVTNRELQYQAASDVDPLFCALLLRLADLLDFDETRAPAVLFDSAADYEESRKEWDKHRASAGFRYPASPSAAALPYKAVCKNPEIEHTVRTFLDWVDVELDHCARLRSSCHAGWQREFPFPGEVLRSEIVSDGYMSGDFCLTMDQQQVLQLLMGENLYENRDVFVRELLQNAVDATLLRGQMDASFVAEDARIDLWEWNDAEGNYWFRIDDQGTGMTLGMLQRYFLRVGNSYYNSQELKKDLLDHGHRDEFYGISRFGIGFLSCFLCADYAEVSTLYFYGEKNRSEEPAQRTAQSVRYGLRLQVKGLSGYYMLKNQAQGHIAESPLPAPGFCNNAERAAAERYGYRREPGTSIALRLVPGKTGALDLREAAKKYLCWPKMKIYYNGERIGQTYAEAMKSIHQMAGEHIYEPDLETKKRFDACFPALRGNAPKLAQTVIPLDTEENRMLPGLSGVIVKYDIRFDQEPRWTAKDQEYEIESDIVIFDKVSYVSLISKNVADHISGESRYWQKFDSDFKWENLKDDCTADQIEELEKKLDTFETCPRTEELGDVWTPFSTKFLLSRVWKTYVDKSQIKKLEFDMSEYEYNRMDSVLENTDYSGFLYAYQGITADREIGRFYAYELNTAIFYLGREWKPTVEVSRSRITDMPLIVKMAIYFFAEKYDFLYNIAGSYMRKMLDWENITLVEWRNVRNSGVGQWILRNYNEEIEAVMLNLKRVYYQEVFMQGSLLAQIGNRYIFAFLQDRYEMTIQYEKGQIVTFCEKDKDCDHTQYDLFPALLFCRAASEQSRKYICDFRPVFRRGITADHPFTVWLAENAVLLNLNFKRQFQQLTECLRLKDGNEFAAVYNAIREQLCSIADPYGLDAKSMPRISVNDFWMDETVQE